jgi:5-methyltetrahydropteroyltriglutamate--homocysteine methyltransferase
VKRSTDRILTTHTGSLPRPSDLAALLLDSNDSLAKSDSLRERVRAAVHEVVQRQVAAGIDVVSDGEMGKPGFAHYVKDRLSGFQGNAAPRPFAPRDLLDFPEVARRLFVSDGKELPRPPMPANDGPIGYIGWDQLAAELDALTAAIENQSVAEAFLPAVSPGCVAMLMGTTYYDLRRDYLYALADALREEYQSIVSRGFLLQIDCPDLALGRHLEFPDASTAEFRAVIELHVEALNHALEGIDPDRVRILCLLGQLPGSTPSRRAPRRHRGDPV